MKIEEILKEAYWIKKQYDKEYEDLKKSILNWFEADKRKNEKKYDADEQIDMRKTYIWNIDVGKLIDESKILNEDDAESFFEKLEKDNKFKQDFVKFLDLDDIEYETAPSGYYGNFKVYRGTLQDTEWDGLELKVIYSVSSFSDSVA